MAQSVLACFKTGYWLCGISSSSCGRLSPRTWHLISDLGWTSSTEGASKTQEQPHHLFSSMSTFSISKGGWKCGFTLHITQRRSHPVYCLLHWICQYLDGFRVCPGSVCCCNTHPKSLCCVVRAANWRSTMLGRSKRESNPQQLNRMRLEAKAPT